MTCTARGAVLAIVLVVAGCPADDDASDTDIGMGTDTDDGMDGPPPLPPLQAAPRTTEITLAVTHAIDEEATLDPRSPAVREQLLAEGFGAYATGPGEPVLDVTPAGDPPPPPGPGRALVTRFVHLADAQLADDESPLRVLSLDTPSIAGAFRPQEHDGCRMLNAAVRTINALHVTTPVDFVLLGGDNADSAQTNEVSWVLSILDGTGPVHCDSGADDDLVPGPDNDGKDPFGPVGLDMPWLWVSGNHDVLVQGNFTVADRMGTAVGAEVAVGGSTRDWSMPGGPAFAGPVVPDPQRALLDNPALLAMVAASGDGHGINDDALARQEATYAWDVPGTSLRFVIVDTAAPTGSDRGVIVDADVQNVLRPLFDQARADGMRVIVASHHASNTLDDGGGLGGSVQPGALATTDWQSLLGEYDNVLMHLAGHSHEHRADWIAPPGGSGYWEVVTSALADWPQQMRLIEVYDEANGFWSISAVGIDFSTDGDPVAEEGRVLANLDYTSGWWSGNAGTLDDRNVRLFVPVP